MDLRLRQWVTYRPINRVRPSYPMRNPNIVSPYSGNTRRIARPISSPQQQPTPTQQPRRGCCGGRK